MTWLWVALFGAVGSLARYLLGGAAQTIAGTRYPIAALTVNVLGSAAIGAVMVLAAARGELDSSRRVTLTAGLLGGFTTYSAFAWDTLDLLERGRRFAAAGYVVVTIVGCLGACAAGAAVVRALAARS